MRKNGHGHVAAMHEAFDHPGPQAVAQTAAASGQIERRGVAVEIRKPGKHFAKDGEIVPVDESTRRATVRGDHGDPHLQGRAQLARIRELGTNLIDRIFPAGVGDERQTLRRDLFPEAAVARQPAFHVVTVGQKLQRGGAGRHAPRQFLQRIGPRGMNRHDRPDGGVFAGQLQHRLIRHVKRASPRPAGAVFAINGILREKRHGVERRTADVFKETLRVNPVEVAVEVGAGQPHGPHEKG